MMGGEINEINKVRAPHDFIRENDVGVDNHRFLSPSKAAKNTVSSRMRSQMRRYFLVFVHPYSKEKYTCKPASY
jgi:hypothetical protein